MEKDLSALPPELSDAVLETLGDPFVAEVYATITERPGVTISQIAGRIEASPRRVRHRIDQMIRTGLVEVESETPRGNIRQRHYRAISLARVLAEMDRSFDDEKRRAIARSVIRLITNDVGRSLREGTLGTHLAHQEIRIPAEVDERGWSELADLIEGAHLEMEAAAIRSAARLEAAGEAGFEAIAALLLFEGRPWEEHESRSGPRPSMWSPEELSARGEGTGGDLSALHSRLRGSLIEVMSDPLDARIYTTVVERPGVTISQVTARTGDPQRRVRHRIERMLAAGLIEVKSETRRADDRRRHYRAVALPIVLPETDEAFDDERRRKVAGSVLRMITTDVGRSLRNGTLGNHAGHAEVRIPAELDERGWLELSGLIERVREEMEAAAIRSAARLEATGTSGIEAVAVLLLFEGAPWAPAHDDREGPRRSVWTSGELAGTERHPVRSSA